MLFHRQSKLADETVQLTAARSLCSKRSWIFETGFVPGGSGKSPIQLTKASSSCVKESKKAASSFSRDR